MLDLVANNITNNSQNTELDPSFAQFRDQTRFWIQRVAVPIILVIGLFGNLITVIIMTRRRMRSTTNMYLAALAFVDMFYLLLTFLLGLSHYPNMAATKYYAYWQMRPFLMMLTDACSNTSVWLIVTFTIERYIAVKYPMKGKVWCTEERAKKLIVGVVFFCILFASPVPFEWQVIERQSPIVTVVETATSMEESQPSSTGAYHTPEVAIQQRRPEQSQDLRTSNRQEAVVGLQVIESARRNNSTETGRILTPVTSNNNDNNSTQSERTQQQQNVAIRNNLILALDYSDFGRNETYKTIYYWSTAVIFYFIPLFSLILFNGFLIKSVHQSQKERNKMTAHKGSTRNVISESVASSPMIITSTNTKNDLLSAAIRPVVPLAQDDEANSVIIPIPTGLRSNPSLIGKQPQAHHQIFPMPRKNRAPLPDSNSNKSVVLTNCKATTKGIGSVKGEENPIDLPATSGQSKALSSLKHFHQKCTKLESNSRDKTNGKCTNKPAGPASDQRGQASISGQVGSTSAVDHGQAKLTSRDLLLERLVDGSGSDTGGEENNYKVGNSGGCNKANLLLKLNGVRLKQRCKGKKKVASNSSEHVNDGCDNHKLGRAAEASARSAGCSEEEEECEEEEEETDKDIGTNEEKDDHENEGENENKDKEDCRDNFENTLDDTIESGVLAEGSNRLASKTGPESISMIDGRMVVSLRDKDVVVLKTSHTTSNGSDPVSEVQKIYGHKQVDVQNSCDKTMNQINEDSKQDNGNKNEPPAHQTLAGSIDASGARRSSTTMIEETGEDPDESRGMRRGSCLQDSRLPAENTSTAISANKMPTIDDKRQPCNNRNTSAVAPLHTAKQVSDRSFIEHDQGAYINPGANSNTNCTKVSSQASLRIGGAGLRTSSSVRSCATSSSQIGSPISNQERRITIMLIAVVILFLVCQIPSAAMLIYTSVHETKPNSNEHALVLAFGNIFNFLMAVNAAGNFILYSFLSKKYRKTFVLLFCNCYRKRQVGRQMDLGHESFGQQQQQQQQHFGSKRHASVRFVSSLAAPQKGATETSLVNYSAAAI